MTPGDFCFDDFDCGFFLNATTPATPSAGSTETVRGDTEGGAFDLAFKTSVR